MSFGFRFGSIGLITASALALSSACGSSADAPPGGGSGGGNGGGSAASGGGTGNAGGSGGINIGGLGGDAAPDGPNPDANCGLFTEKALNTPLHIYIMMDKSSSMAGPQWDAASKGLIAFIKDPASTGLYVGLKFFPRDPDSTPACDWQPYAVPDTPFDVLPTNTSALESAITLETPDGFNTPTWPALSGAINKGIEIAKNNPGHTSAVLLVTDGVPQGPAPLCSGVDPTSTTEIAKLAQLGAAYTPPVLTYVIGLPGVDQSFANAVAQSGGTTSAILVSTTNVQQEFQNALASVRCHALPCEFALPEKVQNGQFTPSFVNVFVTPGGGSATNIGKNPNPNCGGGDGWQYDADPPTKILLCPNWCDKIKQDCQAKVEIELGCETVVIK